MTTRPPRTAPTTIGTMSLFSGGLCVVVVMLKVGNVK
jgi:hypothetical protein